ncbi:MAG: hypothetical protein ACOX6E_09250 [Syntrophomonadaceae bacterium]
MEFKTKSHTFTLLSADVSADIVKVVFYQNGETPDELLDIFKSTEETSTVYVEGKELSGYTEFVSLQTQESAGNEEDQELVAIVSLKKPDLTAEKLKAALIHLSLTTGNTEIAEGIDV